ncbi:sugar ABC transporter ATP-binding protein [Amaricoccus sp.]|uniref:sugar ABC transporter ATP-binding protein n=1 Tax=Amaricoccus sp. TaxID=1872485 RepID=UPI001B62CBF1|nr:sugar ABC transporter ATP-binding protein [Amaricoccus sp.]MBP7002755.1 sugar ABC transporter ATP-binding protein [Amaricoccus sp.]
MANNLQMASITKRFGGVAALSNVTFEARGGEVHALLGENGAGKSTLMRVLSGDHQPDGGHVTLDGERLALADPRTARDHGIAVIYQEFALCPHLSVAENIFIGDLGFGRRIVDWNALYREAAALVASLGLAQLDVRRPVSDLSVAEQQIVEICKALRRDSRVIVFDEPSAVLTERETRQLFQLIRRLRESGVCVIYISHRLEEIFEICDRATIMKDGTYVATVNISDIDQTRLVELMVGRELTHVFPPRHATIGELVLEVERLRLADLVEDVSFTVRAGEVLGFYGLIGSGRTETMRAIFGADRAVGGEVRLNGRLVLNASPGAGVESGFGMVPEDRKGQGVLLDLSIATNIMLRRTNPTAGPGGVLNLAAEKEQVDRMIRALRIKTPDGTPAVSTLSGGNQQKVALARWLAADLKVLILDEPTRGVDVGAKSEIYQIINDVAERGLAVIVISSDLPELIGIADRIAVMRLGEITGELAGGEMNEKALVALAMGVKE